MWQATGKCKPWAVTVSWIVYTVGPTGKQCEHCSLCLPLQNFYFPFQIISVNSANLFFGLRLEFTLPQPAVSWAFSHSCQTAQIVARPAFGFELHTFPFFHIVTASCKLGVFPQLPDCTNCCKTRIWIRIAHISFFPHVASVLGQSWSEREPLHEREILWNTFNFRFQVFQLWIWASVWWGSLNCNVKTRCFFFVFSPLEPWVASISRCVACATWARKWLWAKLFILWSQHGGNVSSAVFACRFKTVTFHFRLFQ